MGFAAHQITEGEIGTSTWEPDATTNATIPVGNPCAGAKYNAKLHVLCEQRNNAFIASTIGLCLFLYNCMITTAIFTGILHFKFRTLKDIYFMSFVTYGTCVFPTCVMLSRSDLGAGFPAVVAALSVTFLSASK